MRSSLKNKKENSNLAQTKVIRNEINQKKKKQRSSKQTTHWQKLNILNVINNELKTAIPKSYFV